MLVVVRVILHCLYIIVGIRETQAIAVCAVGQCKIISLVYTCTEDIFPLVVINRSKWTFCTIKVGNLFAGIISGTIGIDGFAVWSNNVVAIAVEASVTETCSCFLCVAKCPVIITRTEFLLDFRHVSHLVEAYVCAEVNMCSGSFLSLFGSNHYNTISCLWTIKSWSCCTLQYRDIFNILWVDIYETVWVDSLVAPIVIIVGITIMDWHAIKNQ